MPDLLVENQSGCAVTEGTISELGPVKIRRDLYWHEFQAVLLLHFSKKACRSDYFRRHIVLLRFFTEDSHYWKISDKVLIS